MLVFDTPVAQSGGALDTKLAITKPAQAKGGEN